MAGEIHRARVAAALLVSAVTIARFARAVQFLWVFPWKNSPPAVTWVGLSGVPGLDAGFVVTAEVSLVTRRSDGMFWNG